MIDSQLIESWSCWSWHARWRRYSMTLRCKFFLYWHLLLARHDNCKSSRLRVTFVLKRKEYCLQCNHSMLGMLWCNTRLDNFHMFKQETHQ